MTVEYTRPALQDYRKLLTCSTASVDGLALMATIYSAEAQVEYMVEDSVVHTKASIDEKMLSVREMALSIAAEALDDLKSRVLARIQSAEIDVKVSALRYSDVDGLLDDIDCTVKFS